MISDITTQHDRNGSCTVDASDGPSAADSRILHFDYRILHFEVDTCCDDIKLMSTLLTDRIRCLSLLQI